VIGCRLSSVDCCFCVKLSVVVACFMQLSGVACQVHMISVSSVANFWILQYCLSAPVTFKPHPKESIAKWFFDY
jgi:hypothetical protein